MQGTAAPPEEEVEEDVKSPIESDVVAFGSWAIITDCNGKVGVKVVKHRSRGQKHGTQH